MLAGPEKIYVRETTGWFTNWRWASVWLTQLLFFGMPWLSWNARPLLRFDWSVSKFYVLGLVWGPQQGVYLFAWLLMAILAICVATTMVSRIWCGFACPHTIYTDVFMWIERRIEGGRSARMRLDQAPWAVRKGAKKLLKHGIWALLSCAIGLTFVGYFTPIRELLSNGWALTMRPWQGYWMLAYGGLAYLNAGWLRERICRDVCPYSRFQHVMLHSQTHVVSYDAARGEPRGLRNRKRMAQNLPRGDCVDCTLCVQVCPSGNDIRLGFSHDCMGCAACIDACNAVMDKIGAPRGLIRYAHHRATGQSGGRLAVPSSANGGGK